MANNCGPSQPQYSGSPHDFGEALSKRTDDCPNPRPQFQRIFDPQKRQFRKSLRSKQGRMYPGGVEMPTGTPGLNYQQKFDSLNRMIKEFASTLFAKVRGKLGLDAATQIVNLLKGLLPEMEHVFTILEPALVCEMYAHPSAGSFLVRHIISVFLYSQIFRPYVLGLDECQSQVFRDLEVSYSNQGTSRHSILLLTDPSGTYTSPGFPAISTTSYYNQYTQSITKKLCSDPSNRFVKLPDTAWCP
jgi:hypothetical protein